MPAAVGIRFETKAESHIKARKVTQPPPDKILDRIKYRHADMSRV